MSKTKVLLFAALLFSAACSPVYRNHGYVPPDTDLDQVIVGQTTQEELGALIGRPSAQGLLTGSGWYYVGSRWEFFGPRAPKEINRQVLAVSFAEDGTVTNIERFGAEQGQVVTLSRRVTEGGVSSISIIRQLMGNIGRFRAQDVIE